MRDKPLSLLEHALLDLQEGLRAAELIMKEKGVPKYRVIGNTLAAIKVSIFLTSRGI